MTCTAAIRSDGRHIASSSRTRAQAARLRRELNGAGPLWLRLLDTLCCPRCRKPLAVLHQDADPEQAVLGHPGAGCTERYPVIDGIPRLVGEPTRTLVHTRHAAWFAHKGRQELLAGWQQASAAGHDALVTRFDAEWKVFSQVGHEQHAQLFRQYFDIVPAELLDPGRVVVDAGCGAGRWALEAQRRGATLLAFDLGFSVEHAARNTRATGRVLCVQADVRSLPVRAGAADLVYSLGVLHHIADTEAGLRCLVRAARPLGTVLVYLYYALDDRGPAYRALFGAVDRVRRVTSRLPQPLLSAFATTVATGAYFPLARTSRLLRSAGLVKLSRLIPLAFYADLPLSVMRNDSLDRFGTTLEKRYRREEVRALMEAAGLSRIVISPGPPWWHATGVKEARV